MLAIDEVLKVWAIGGFGGGGYVSLDHFVLRFIGVSFTSVGGAVCVNIMDICRVLAMVSICWFLSISYLMGVFSWCMQSTWMARLYVLGSIFVPGGIVRSLYVMVSTLKCVMTCEYRKGRSS